MKTHVLSLIAFVSFLSLVVNPGVAQWQENGIGLATSNLSEKWSQVMRTSEGNFVTGWVTGFQVLDLECLDPWGNTLWTASRDLSYTSVGEFKLVNDNNGGGFLVFKTADVYETYSEYNLSVQKFDKEGNWTTGQYSIFTGFDAPIIKLEAIEDGLDGCLVAWTDSYNESNDQAHIQHIGFDGAPLWNHNHVQWTVSEFSPLELVSDGYGGSMVCFIDNSFEIMVNRYNVYGEAQWGLGLLLSTSDYPVSEPALAPWGRGVQVLWKEVRTDREMDGDIAMAIVAQDGSGAGTVSYLDSSTHDDDQPDIRGDGNGQFAVVWRRNGSSILWKGGGMWASESTVGSGSNPQIVDFALTTDHGNVNSPSYAALFLYTKPGLGGSTDLFATRAFASITPHGVYSTDWVVPVYCGIGEVRTASAISDGENGLVSGWSHDLQYPYFYDSAVQRIHRHGHWGIPSATIISALDIPDDQGGFVNLTWEASRLEHSSGNFETVNDYSLWRSISETYASKMVEQGANIGVRMKDKLQSGSEAFIFNESHGDKTIYWEYIGSVAPFGLYGYAFEMPTVVDSTFADNGHHNFLVVTETSNATKLYPSSPGSGYSVDNIAPEAPQQLNAAQSYEPLGLELGWLSNQETDVSDYVIHAGNTPDFIPDLASFVMATSHTTAFLPDRTWGAEVLKVAARDAHGNTGVFSSFSAGSVSAVDIPDNKIASMVAYPNPFNPMTKIEFIVPRSAMVKLQIYDASGRLVKTLVKEPLAAGSHVVDWQGGDDMGQAVSSGVYFLQLRGDGFEINKRVSLVR